MKLPIWQKTDIYDIKNTFNRVHTYIIQVVCQNIFSLKIILFNAYFYLLCGIKNFPITPLCPTANLVSNNLNYIKNYVP